MLRKLFNDEAGFVLSAELAIIATLTIAAAAVGAAAIRDSISQELDDVADSIGSLDQSWNIRSFSNEGDGAAGYNSAEDHGAGAGSGYNDEQDDCDCKGVEFAAVCGHDGAGNGASESNSTNP